MSNVSDGRLNTVVDCWLGANNVVNLPSTKFGCQQFSSAICFGKYSFLVFKFWSWFSSAVMQVDDVISKRDLVNYMLVELIRDEINWM